MTGGRASLTLSASVDRADLRALLQALNTCDEQAQSDIRDVAGGLASTVVVALREHAAASPTPAANLVARSAQVKRDRIVAVVVGGAKKVGRGYRSTARTKTGKRSSKVVRAAAGTLLYGTEYGGQSGTDRSGRAYSNRFGARPLPHTEDSGYWINQAVRTTLPKARDAWVQAVIQRLRGEGMEVTYGP